MKYIVNSQEMKLYDKNTIDELGVPSVVLMERAALAFVDELRRRQIDPGRVLVVCGSGNNGGDGYAIARLLYLEGHAVDVVAADADSPGATEENRRQRDIWQAYGQTVFTQIPERTDYTAVIDAVFGVGLSRNVEGRYAALITRMNALPGTKLAVDIASGISADNGEVLGVAFSADITITFAFAKLGSILWPGNEYAGTVIVRDIGINAHSFFGQEPGVAALTEDDLVRLPARAAHSNKGTYGKLLVIAGSSAIYDTGMAGAAFLSSKAAYACGCGLVRIFTPEENRPVLQTMLPEAVVTTYSAKELDETALKSALSWADAVVCGPGLGTSDVAGQLVRGVLESASVPVLLDADALNIISWDVGLLAPSHGELILTPHLGEMGRLTGKEVSYLQNHLIEVAEDFSVQYNVICVLKDEHTVTAVPGSHTCLNLSGNSGMATAGSGDVLSGVIGSLLAQGLPPREAAPLGVYLHGMAGDCILADTGERGMMASDLIRGLRMVLRG